MLQVNRYTHQLEAAVKAVGLACRITREIQQKAGGPMHVSKADASPVSIADFAAQAVVNHVLDHDLGGVKIVAEESAAMLREESHKSLADSVLQHVRTVWPEATLPRVLDAIDLGNHDGTSDSYWALDPIDGTKGYLRGEQYAVCLALIEGGEVVVAAMGCPNLSTDFDRPFTEVDPHGVLFLAVRGEGAWSVPTDAPQSVPHRVEVAPRPVDASIRVCESIERAHTRREITHKVIEKLGGTGPSANLDSQAKYGVVARGQADAYLRIPAKPGYAEKIWDHAPGSLIVQEAGGIVSDSDGKPLDFKAGTTLSRNRGIVAAIPVVHGLVVNAIREVRLKR